jgi:hypothetical protein
MPDAMMYYKFNKYEDIIVRMHTDGFMTREEPEGILTGTDWDTPN